MRSRWRRGLLRLHHARSGRASRDTTRAMAIRGFLFDLDGTLVDSERETSEAMARALWRGHGIALDQYDRDFIVGRSWIAIYDSLRTRHPELAWSLAETIAQTALLRDEVFAELGVTVLPG